MQSLVNAQILLWYATYQEKNRQIGNNILAYNYQDSATYRETM